MSDSMPYADIIILALIAGFVLLRLRSVLGQKIGHDGSQYSQSQPRPRAESDSPVVKMTAERIQPAAEAVEDPDKELIATITDTSLKETIAAIKAVDAGFSLTHFLTGARAAFEMVFDAFAKDGRDTLKMLLSQPLYDVFSAELDKRKDGEVHTETTLLSVVSHALKEGTLQKNTARLHVHFVSEQVTVGRDKSGKIVEGDPSRVEHVEDEWIFERDLSSRNPNWKIIET